MDVPVASTRLTFADTLGTWRVRWGYRRSGYRVEPGLYRVGTPGPDSPVLVTANYKLSFDVVRSHLAGLHAWLLVLDTKGVNVWCAAGKGTFGTDELVHRIATTGLDEVVRHRTIVVPQLGAPGVASREVRERSGFRVVFGPVRARDIRAYLEAGLHAQPEMRRVTFTARERLAVTGVEIAGAARIAIPLLMAAWLVWLVATGADAVVPDRPEMAVVVPFLAALFAGLVLTPLLLPWLPGRMFALKGAVAGVILVGAALALDAEHWSPTGALGVLLLGAAVSSYFAMNFTGSTTFTSPSGVEKELRRALPLQAAAVAVATVVLLAGWLVV